jgi:hypothetical protein
MVSGFATGMYCPRLFALEAPSPGRVSTNFRMDGVNAQFGVKPK